MKNEWTLGNHRPSSNLMSSPIPHRNERRALYIKERFEVLSGYEEEDEAGIKLDIAILEDYRRTTLQKIQSIEYRIFHHEAPADLSPKWKKTMYIRLLASATRLQVYIHRSRTQRDMLWRKLLRRSRGDIQKKLFAYRHDILRKRKLIDISVCQLCILECNQQLATLRVEQTVARELQETARRQNNGADCDIDDDESSSNDDESSSSSSSSNDDDESSSCSSSDYEDEWE